MMLVDSMEKVYYWNDVVRIVNEQVSQGYVDFEDVEKLNSKSVKNACGQKIDRLENDWMHYYRDRLNDCTCNQDVIELCIMTFEKRRKWIDKNSRWML